MNNTWWYCPKCRRKVARLGPLVLDHGSIEYQLLELAPGAVVSPVIDDHGGRFVECARRHSEYAVKVID